MLEQFYGMLGRLYRNS